MGMRLLGATVTCGWESPDMGAQKQTPVLCKGSKCSQPLSDLPSPNNALLLTAWIAFQSHLLKDAFSGIQNDTSLRINRNGCSLYYLGLPE